MDESPPAPFDQLPSSVSTPTVTAGSSSGPTTKSITSITGGEQFLAPPVSFAEPLPCGDYLLLKRLGVGGMAEVFLAERVARPGEQVVIKRMLPHLAEQPRYVEMFRREARLAQALHHENIVALHGLEKADNQLLIVMEYVDGLTLHQIARRWWRAGGTIPIEFTIRAIADTAAALQFAFNHPGADGLPACMVHRDISPDNLIVDLEGHTRVLDFGIAKTVESQTVTKTGEMKGKIPFMPPEQINGLPLGHAADIYSLGVTWFWLLTGRRPFRNGSDLRLMQSVVRDPAPLASTFNPNVPPAIDTWLANMLAKKPESRPSGTLISRELRKLVPAVTGSVKSFLRDVRELDLDAGRKSRRGNPYASAPTTDIVSRCQTWPSALRDPVVLNQSQTEPPDFDLAVEDDAPIEPLVPIADAKSTSPLAALVGGVVLVGCVGLFYAFFTGANDDEALPALPPPSAVAAEIPSAKAGAASVPVIASGKKQPGPDATTPAARPKDVGVTADKPAPKRVQKKTKQSRRTAKKQKVRVSGSGGRWRYKKRSISVSAGSALVDPRARALVFRDRKTGGVTTVPIVKGHADLGAVKKGKLAVRVFPFAEVSLGRRKLGSTPFPPISLRAGTYSVRMVHKGKTVKRSAVVKAGQTVVLKVDMRTAK